MSILFRLIRAWKSGIRQLPFLLVLYFLLSVSSVAQSSLNPCGSDDKYGYCDPSGKYIIEPRFQKAHPFEGNLAAVALDGQLWMINKKGKLRFNTRQYADAEPPIMEQGLYKVQYFDPIFADVTEYYNRKGQPVKLTSGADPQTDTLYYTLFNANQAAELAKTKLGTPYGTDGLDCSGFIRFIFGGYGIVLPYFAREIGQKGEDIPLEKAQPGDLIFFCGSNAYDKTVNHVGYVLNRLGTTVEFIHASTSKGVTINKTTDAYFKQRFLSVRRIFE